MILKQLHPFNLFLIDNDVEYVKRETKGCTTDGDRDRHFTDSDMKTKRGRDREKA